MDLSLDYLQKNSSINPVYGGQSARGLRMGRVGWTSGRLDGRLVGRLTGVGKRADGLAGDFIVQTSDVCLNWLAVGKTDGYVNEAVR